MRRFRFRLERLAHLASAERRLLGGELAEARRKQMNAEIEAERARLQLVRASDEWSRRVGRGETADLLAAADAAYGEKADGVRTKDEEVSRRAEEVEGRREDWLSARKRTEMFGRLEARQKETYDAERRVNDQAVLDEAAGHMKGGEKEWQ